jgi:hypothetical protein
LQAFRIPVDKWRDLAQNRPAWKATVKNGASVSENDRRDHARGKRERRKNAAKEKGEGKKKSAETPVEPPSTENTNWPCELCGRVCRSRIGLHSQQLKCRTTPES